jgi:fatty acid/phospholipid biosynthesis enzyme
MKRKPVEYLKDLILESGFNINTINVDGFKLKYSDGTAFLIHSLIKNAFMEPWKALLPENLVSPVFNTIEDRLNRVAADQGEVSMSVPYVCFDCKKQKPVKG